jgi:hypothetical protein
MKTLNLQTKINSQNCKEPNMFKSNTVQSTNKINLPNK